MTGFPEQARSSDRACSFPGHDATIPNLPSVRGVEFPTMTSRSLWCWALAFLTALVGASASARASDPGCCCVGASQAADRTSCDHGPAQASTQTPRQCQSADGLGCPCRATPKAPDPMDRAPRAAPRQDAPTWDWAPAWASAVPRPGTTPIQTPTARRGLGAPPRAMLSVWVV